MWRGFGAHSTEFAGESAFAPRNSTRGGKADLGRLKVIATVARMQRVERRRYPQICLKSFLQMRQFYAMFRGGFVILARNAEFSRGLLD
jgi:hypothetical protein